MSNDLTRGY